MSGMDLSVLFNFSFGILVLIAYSILTILQLFEMRRPNDRGLDWLPGVRKTLFLVFLFTVITLVPSLTYQLCRLLGTEAEGMRSIATVTSRINTVITLVLIFKLYVDA